MNRLGVGEGELMIEWPEDDDDGTNRQLWVADRVQVSVDGALLSTPAER